MKIKSHLTLATLIVAGMFVAGCSQQQSAGSQQMSGSQQTTGGQQVADNSGGNMNSGGGTAPATGACDPKTDKWCHYHPEAPDCAMSKWHSHPYKDPNHRHTYGCLAGSRPQMPPPQIPHVKVKGNYKGPVYMGGADTMTMRQYQR